MNFKGMFHLDPNQ